MSVRGCSEEDPFPVSQVFKRHFYRNKPQGFEQVPVLFWRRKWQPTPVFLPGEFHGQRSMAGYSPWGHKESDTTEWLRSTFIHWHSTLRKSLSSLFLHLFTSVLTHKFLFYSEVCNSISLFILMLQWSSEGFWNSVCGTSGKFSKVLEANGHFAFKIFLRQKRLCPLVWKETLTNLFLA